MLSASDILAWVDDYGPWLYWGVSHPARWPWILRDGIQPRTTAGVSGSMGKNMESRPGCIYFLTDWIYAARRASGVTGEPQVRVDIRGLDPARFVTDEDRIAADTAWGRQTAAIQGLPGWGTLTGPSSPSQVGAWMNSNAAVVDQREWVLHSMRGHSVAYVGGIAISDVEIIGPYVRDDWDPAPTGEPYTSAPAGQPPKYFKGLPETLA